MNKKAFPLILLGVDAYMRFSKALIDLGFIPISLPRDERLPLPVSSHADMLIFIIDNVVFCNEEYYSRNKSIFEKIEQYGYSVNHSNFIVDNRYPNDIALNQALIGKYIIGKSDSCARQILDYAHINRYEYISTKQGYAKCSTLILNKNAIITADDSIVKIATDLRLDSLKINNADFKIKLEGYNYGFIGGASFVYNNQVVFFGNMDNSKGEKDILEFCKKHGFSTLSLDKDELTDVGGAFVIPYIAH